MFLFFIVAKCNIADAISSKYKAANHEAVDDKNFRFLSFMSMRFFLNEYIVTVFMLWNWKCSQRWKSGHDKNKIWYPTLLIKKKRVPFIMFLRTRRTYYGFNKITQHYMEV